MNWSQPRKADIQAKKRVSTTCLNTPPTNSKVAHQQIHPCSTHTDKKCPYHFSSPSHICLTCRRSICLRCAITYCQQHTIHPQEEILPLLLVDLEKLTIEPRIEDIQLKLKQSQEKQEFMSKKISKMLNQIEQHFEHVKIMLDRKKEQIIQYYHEELANKFLSQYKKQDDELFDILSWLRDIQQNSHNCDSIQELDDLAKIVKKKSQKYASSDSSASLNTSQKVSNNSSSKERLEKGMTFLFGKEKIKFHKIWSEQRLQKVLFEIENISFKLNNNNNMSTQKVPSNKKKRVTTETSEHGKISAFFSGTKNTGAMVKSGSNSRFNTGRKVQ